MRHPNLVVVGRLWGFSCCCFRATTPYPSMVKIYILCWTDTSHITENVFVCTDKVIIYSVVTCARYWCIVQCTYTSEEGIRNIIKLLKNGSSGWDEILAKIIKISCSPLLKPLCNIFNLSLYTGVFPDALKLVKVVPLYKAGDAHKFSNYRPISVLPVFSKVFEQLMYNRLLAHINANNLLNKFQFGFRNKHSPNLAMIYLIDKISNALQNGDLILGLFLDFSKAFDTVDHDILLHNLEFCGIRGCAHDWFKSYMTNRKQFVQFDSHTSSVLSITCGVPQGSILGPFLFLIYINDLAYVSSKAFFMLFADDANILYQETTPINLSLAWMKGLLKWLNG